MKFKSIPTSFLVLGSVVFFSLALVVSAVIIGGQDSYIRTLGGNELASGGFTNSISVSGNGKAISKPDLMTFRIEISETRQTSQEALEDVNKKISEVKSVLDEEDIPENDVQTSSFNIYTEYDYTQSGRKVVGQRASQTLTIKVKDLDEKATKAVKVIDRVSTIENIEIFGISFDIEDKTELFTLAREEAFKKAEQKAKELSDLGDVKLLKPISISDQNIDYSSPVYRNVATFESEMLDAASPSSDISTGELEVNARIQVVFGIE